MRGAGEGGGVQTLLGLCVKCGGLVDVGAAPPRYARRSMGDGGGVP